MPRVLVSGCFDLLHSGHVRWLEHAARLGELWVSLGSDDTVRELKGRSPAMPADERASILRALRCVSGVVVSPGHGMLDFKPVLSELKPDVFVVNTDGDLRAKRKLCESFGIRYEVLPLDRVGSGAATRSTTALRALDCMPYRLDLAGGWLDQPAVNTLCPGPVVTVSLEPSRSFNLRSGMATSTRNKAIDLWGYRLPRGDYEKLARTLFAVDNPPGTVQVSGSQDSIGIVYPGIAVSHYCSGFWPEDIEHDTSEESIRFIEEHTSLLPLTPRERAYDPYDGARITHSRAFALGEAALDLWSAIQERNVREYGAAMRRSYWAQLSMFPAMRTDEVDEAVASVSEHVLGWKLSGAGGGGYLVVVADGPVPGSVPIHVRRAD